ncbi:Planctomycete cytochrome C [Rubinisphaera italica]|uniref:Planctomycete cytochrome C n=2 Tax=Rubinisphaera italica TaxID=2527969 RepID=A0A5C5XC36_9PLAN|nr:Planctomycete cytochrome C [Rubinisphaera italica]
MKLFMPVKLILLLMISALLCSRSESSAEEIRFSRDVLPILSDRCFHCHGPDESHREADLRLDLKEDAFADRGGYAVIVPHKISESELMTRITTDDETLLMPPQDSHRKPLTDAEVMILRKWIEGGAHWGKHWAYEKPIRPVIPDRAQHPIDYFVTTRLKKAGLSLSSPADKRTLLRRVCFDLTGLPPTSKQAQKFLSDTSADAYEQLVERLLASDHYGERMAMWWLDAARYSDTDGFQQDATRTNWPWRDWVIHEFNSNQPFNKFIREQFAGDLLPNASDEQILATSFHRQHMTNGEGGRDPEESRIDYVIDRVNTTGTVLLGLTLGCAQCHSHKFDPITQEDYYSLFAFFNNIDEDGSAGRKAKPYLEYSSPYVDRAVAEAEQLVEFRAKKVDSVKKRAEQEFAVWLDQLVQQTEKEYQGWTIIQPGRLESVAGTVLDHVGDGIVQTSGPLPRQDDYLVFVNHGHTRITGIRLEIFPHASHTSGKYTRGENGEFILTDIKLQVHQKGRSQLQDIQITNAIADAEPPTKGRRYGLIKDTLDDDPRNGWTTAGIEEIVPHTAVFELGDPLFLEQGEELVVVLLHRSTEGNANIGRFRVSVTDQPGQAVRSLEPMPLEKLALAEVNSSAEVNSELRSELFAQFLVDHIEFQVVNAALEQAKNQLLQVKKAAGKLNVMVLSEKAEKRETHILERGVWDNKGKIVSADVPSAIMSLSSENELSRLDLANWIVSPENPLTSRVISNHLWQLCFGAGLVRTPDDFGLQGEFPSHPDLLDWLALELVESDWNLKHLLKEIVTSQTYRQSSNVSKELYEMDPENRLLARATRFRLPSWMIRDAALLSSGLLNPAIGGPPVMPYQPEGVWKEMFMGRFVYESSQGPAQFRRTIYAFWRRSAAPTFLFDSAQRRVCEVGRRLTNTPLHALTLLNDQTQLEASRELAQCIMKDSVSVEHQVDQLFQRVLTRSPTAEEQAILIREFERTNVYYAKHPDDAKRLLNFGQPENQDDSQYVEQAALMVIASLIFNLDEAISHE